MAINCELRSPAQRVVAQRPEKNKFKKLGKRNDSLRLGTIIVAFKNKNV
jgi:hypothetical protein